MPPASGPKGRQPPSRNPATGMNQASRMTEATTNQGGVTRERAHRPGHLS
ncbi:hypothetical protein KIPB_015972, partial [Kipferlia bialata]|eukprot:g15972.t1